ncbi:MAG: ABC transporter transmembrane domain-containing protein, partial [Bacteroidota bacterium]
MPTYSYKKEVPLRDILKSTKVLFRLAWQTDPITVILFYASAIVGGLIALATSWVLKILIDQLQAGQAEAFTNIPVIIAFSLAAYYLISLVQSLFFHTLHFNYLDYILRNQLQNALTKRYVQKVSELDIAHFENAKTQDLLSQVHGTMKWQIPDIMRLLGYVTTELFSYLAAVLVLIPFGWWIPLVVTLITIPRLYLRSKYGALQWSIWGAGAPEIRKLYYYDGLFSNNVSIREMKIAQSGSGLIEKYGKIQDYLFGLNKAVLLRYLRVSIIPPIVELTVIFLIAYSFLGSALDSTITIGTFTLLVSLLGQVNSSASRASSNFGSLY